MIRKVYADEPSFTKDVQNAFQIVLLHVGVH